MAARVRPSRMRVMVSSRMRSGGWSSKVRGSSSMNSRRAGPSMSPLIEKASATSSFLPACSIASRPTSTPRRAMSIQCSGARWPGALALHLGGEAPRVGRDDVAALLDVAAVHVAHDVGGVDQRPRAPQRLVAPALGVGQAAPELGGDAPVEDHAALGLQQLLDAAIRRRQLAPGGQTRPVLQHAHVGHCRSAPRRRRLPGGRDSPARRGGIRLPDAKTGAGSAKSPRRGWRRSSCAGCS